MGLGNRKQLLTLGEKGKSWEGREEGKERRRCGTNLVWRREESEGEQSE